MIPESPDIIEKLRNEILQLRGFKSAYNKNVVDAGLGQIKYAFPNAVFPSGAIHEFLCNETENFAATSGFVTGLLSAFMRNNGVLLWISSIQTVFPPALKSFGIDPEKAIFINLKTEKDILWTMEEALKCNGLVAVVCEMKELSFTVSRRFQLAAEKSNVTGFIFHQNTKKAGVTACVTRWKITSTPCNLIDDLPGVGFPCWNVELLKVRNGKPGSWQIGWYGNRFRHLSVAHSIEIEPQKKTG